MNWSREWAYFPIAVLVSVIYWLICNRIEKKEPLTTHKIIIWFLVSFLNATGIDLLERFFEAVAIIHVLKICLGVWVLFIFADFINKEKDLKELWLNLKVQLKGHLGKTLLNYFIIGICIYVLT